MANKLYEENDISAIATAIRNKEGEQAGGTMTVAQMPTRIANLPSGAGVPRPTTWAEFAAMSVANQQKCYGVGDRVGISCPWVSPSNGTTYDLTWEIAGFGTTKKENDNTEYPCVTLVARLGTPGTYQFDAAETPTAATEETAQDGIYYFGYNGSTYTALNLSTGDTIPYGDYTAVYKTDVTGNVNYFNDIRQYGYNVYKYSAIRQWLNSDAAANNWWQASHVGDVAPSYANQAGFMSGFGTDFKNILQRTEVITAGNNTTDNGALYSTYDYFFLPSRCELYATTSPAEGAQLPYFAVGGSGKNGLRSRGPASGGSANTWRQRSAYQGSAYSAYYVTYDGTANINSYAITAYQVVAACKIILQS